MIWFDALKFVSRCLYELRDVVSWTAAETDINQQSYLLQLIRDRAPEEFCSYIKSFISYVCRTLAPINTRPSLELSCLQRTTAQKLSLLQSYSKKSGQTSMIIGRYYRSVVKSSCRYFVNHRGMINHATSVIGTTFRLQINIPTHYSKSSNTTPSPKII